MGHYKSVRVEGNNPEKLLNLCMIRDLHISKVRYVSENVIILKLKSRDFQEFYDISCSRYIVTVVGESGIIYKLGLFFKQKTLIAGIAIFAAIILYQSLYVAEIEVAGYESIAEQDLRKTMKEAGLYEGCRKNINVSKVKLHMFEKYDNIVWVGIKYKGNLAQVTIAETDELYEKNRVENDLPCNVVAEKSGYINSVDPEQGVRAVEDGQYVKPGHVLISGVVPLAKTTYEEGSEEETETYVHAAGTVDARIPVRLVYYELPQVLVKNRTGKKMITLSVNNNEIMGNLCRYETASVKRFTICNWVKPVRVKITLNLIEEVVVEKKKKTDKELKKQVLNEIHEHVKEKLPDNTQILNKSLNFTREKNIIRIGVTLETLQQIGIEEEIVVDKSNGKSEKDDNQ